MKASMAMLGKNETAGSDNSASYNLQLNITALNSFEAKIKQNVSWHFSKHFSTAGNR